MMSNDLGYAFGRGGQHLICFSKTRLKSEVTIDLSKLIVINHNERIYAGAQSINTFLSLSVTGVPLKLKRNGYNTYCEYPQVFRQSCNYGSSTRSGSASHTGSDKYHLGIGL